MQYQPLFDRVIAEPLDKTKSIGGMTLQDKSHLRHATVVNVGKDVTDVCIGDHIIYEDFAGINIELDGNQFVVIKQLDILIKGETKCK